MARSLFAMGWSLASTVAKLKRWHQRPMPETATTNVEMTCLQGLAEGLSIVCKSMAATCRSADSPWLMWSQHCEAWEATVPGLIKHPRDPNVCADGQPDHILDAVRMALLWWRAKYRIGQSTFRVW